MKKPLTINEAYLQEKELFFLFDSAMRLGNWNLSEFIKGVDSTL